MFNEVYILGSRSQYIRCTWRLTYDVYTYVKQIKIDEVIIIIHILLDLEMVYLYLLLYC